MAARTTRSLAAAATLAAGLLGGCVTTPVLPRPHSSALGLPDRPQPAEMHLRANTRELNPPTRLGQVAAGPLRVWSERRGRPRPLRIHVAQLDLRARHFELTALVASDPDGSGPAEASLRPPTELMAQSPQTVLAINANAFRGLLLSRGMRTTSWRIGRPVDIVGLAVAGGRLLSRPTRSLPALWLDDRGQPHIGRLPARQRVRAGVSGWLSGLLAAGQDVPTPGGALHPRTLVGLDRDRRMLSLVVVDGRQPDYSEGMTLHESAQLMRQLGAHDAINLDGGGSSAMLWRDNAGRIHFVNRPSGSAPRPVPVMLAVQRTGATAGSQGTAE